MMLKTRQHTDISNIFFPKASYRVPEESLVELNFKVFLQESDISSSVTCQFLTDHKK